MVIVLGLERIQALLNALGDPHLRFNVIHVAGTNGKGSVCALLSSVISRSVYRCGMFSSPHIIGPWDCIRIQDKPMSEQDFEGLNSFVRRVNVSNSIDATEFEVLTATALLHFERSKVQLAIVEVGMGGRLDSTNVFPNPLLCVFTPISLDHVEFLGGTIQAIAREKAGILKAGAHAIIGKQKFTEADTVFQEQASSLKVPIVLAQVAKDNDGSETRSVEIAFKGESLVAACPLEGDFQLVNIGIACSALETLDKVSNYKITRPLLLDGLRNVYWPGRMQRLQIRGSTNNFTLDGAHNDHGIQSLAAFVDSKLRKRGLEHIHWVVAFKAGKDYRPMLNELLRDGDTLTCVGFSQPAGMPWVSSVDPYAIGETAKSLFPDMEVNAFKNIDLALSHFKERKFLKSIIVCGSLYLVADTLRSTEIE
ncbi:folylpolyglutamate synthase [Dinochytrium kinnereticum]|nr:folylpolyglutamate synthase [Dinochytrium kinnereticum]